MNEDNCGVCYECLYEIDASRDIKTNPYGMIGEVWGRMIVCTECGNKRCPKATSHKEQCTKSNDPGQQGSRYGKFQSENPK